MLIIGAGMSGLLAAHILRRFNPVIMEAQFELPNNHAALLRFRTDAVSRATGIPFKKVSVQKAICYGGQLLSEGNIALNNMYASKVTGKIIGRSIMNLQPGERYIAPSDFIKQMAASCRIEFGKTFTAFTPSPDRPPLISTMPMQYLMQLAKWKEVPEFGYQGIKTLSCDISDCDVYQTLYYPEHGTPYYRASITGNHLMIEMTHHWIDNSDTNSVVGKARMDMIDKVRTDFGIRDTIVSNVKVTEQKYGKIYPIDNSIRKQFILAMTDRYNVYSIGRFATWRQILMDDVVRDISLVEQMLLERSSYASHLPQ